MLFDVLDKLEWYQKLYPSIETIIDIMDRSLPYEDGDGSHCVDGIDYTVETYVTKSDAPIQAAFSDCMHIILEGEEVIALEEEGNPSVVAMATVGRFILFSKGDQYKSALQNGSPGTVKKVIFTLSGPRL
ncbi:beta-galactosidase, beta subunit [Sphaerochaeta pleomorpha str. Grapes]|uniref:Beta-galactosidase, beta subunit n=1 Tax=Sphaerochaeta pleomorpha (strain ATCC BAA-1885 / DSM 22778 / Grapes) TaxID=158190 RepID=G8QR84_SPHPG|nr:beta-galactosidase subunit beta [Sphaerochaeta pleomorpha]AEV31019.1 beta-galactosidase, beta subunit [Sphaerochaeta pleomorpha str. Grapes]